MNGSTIPPNKTTLPNGVHPRTHVAETEGTVALRQEQTPNGVHTQTDSPAPHLNGRADDTQEHAIHRHFLHKLKDMPPEIEHLSQSFFVPLRQVLQKSAEQCWEGLSQVVDDLSNMPLPQQAQYTNGTTATNGQSKISLDKKDRLLNWANDQKAIFIKTLVLLQWSQNAQAVHQVIDLNKWLRDQGGNFFEAISQVARMKRELTQLQVPNPDITTATEVLSTQRVSGFSDLGYIPRKPLSAKQILKTLKSLNSCLTSRLILHEQLPDTLRDYHVHDGRVTFYVPDLFELDLSLLDEDPTSQFYFVDFRFTFRPSAGVPVGRLHDELQLATDGILGKDGLAKCYDFLHDFTLSYKLNTLYQQAVELAQGTWSGTLRVELIRRTLVVQYWLNRPAGKSWIEIGVKSGRRKAADGSVVQSPAFLDLRWMCYGKEVPQAGVELDLATLSFDRILRQVIACHVSQMLDAIYDGILSLPLYTNKDLSLLEISSYTDPSECRLQVKISKSKTLNISIEPATGAIVLKPASNLCNRVEQELNRAKNVIDILPQRLSYLRCASAEDDLVHAAESAGWTVLRAFRPTLAEYKSLFPPQVLRSVFMCPPHWDGHHMLAATHGNTGDQWWLVRYGEKDGPTLSSQLISGRSRHLEPTISQDYLDRLAHYASALVTLQSNAAALTAMHVRYRLPRMPPVHQLAHLPKLSLDFHPAELQSMLQKESKAIGQIVDPLRLSPSNDTAHKTLIRKTVKITFTGLDRRTGQARIVVSGSSSVRVKVMRYLATSIVDPDITFAAKSRRFDIRLNCRVGNHVIVDLLQRLVHLENIIACVSTILHLPTLSITSCSLQRFGFTYHHTPTADLGLEIVLATPTEPLRLTLTPAGHNPHERIKANLETLLATTARGLPQHVRELLSLLSMTHPLLSSFDALERRKPSESIWSSAATDPPKPLPRVHIIPRSTTAFGIQFDAPPGLTLPDGAGPGKARRMLARFEVLPLRKREQTQWVLRPAIEEFEAYSQASYYSLSLKDKITQEIFTAKDVDGWLPLDSGAVCNLDSPGKLLDAVYTVVNTWLQDESSKPRTEVSSEGQTVATAVQPPQPRATNARPHPGPNGIQNTQNRPPPANRQPPKGSKVIELD